MKKIIVSGALLSALVFSGCGGAKQSCENYLKATTCTTDVPSEALTQACVDNAKDLTKLDKVTDCIKKDTTYCPIINDATKSEAQKAAEVKPKIDACATSA